MPAGMYVHSIHRTTIYCNYVQLAQFQSHHTLSDESLTNISV